MIASSPGLTNDAVGQGAGDGVILRAENVTKVFPGAIALDHVNFDVHRGKVNVLVGENGAGKSTLMKILAGVEQPTSGSVLLDGREIRLDSPHDAASHGIGIIYQELNLCSNLSVVENIFLGQEIVRHGVVDRDAQSRRAAELLQRLEQDVSPEALVDCLRIGQQQVVEIARALTKDTRVLIMDEPTSALSAAEVGVLFRVIRELKSSGVAIIYISHKLDELLEIGDIVTVLRDGRIVAQGEAAEIDVPWIIERMVGRSPASMFGDAKREIGETLLRVEDLTLPRIGGGYLVDHVSFELRAGEILGFYGLMGAGRSDLLDALAGARPGATGRVWIDGELVRGTTVADRIAAGLVLVPEDRQRDGLVQTMSVADNMLLASLEKYLRWLLLLGRRERAAVSDLVAQLSIRTSDTRQPITALSGGNQQKVVVAKGLLTHPKVLLLDEPTRGIDVGAKSEIFEIVARMASEGYGIIFVSSELKEVLMMSDRIFVMSKGAITAAFGRDEATEEKLVAASAVGHGPTARQPNGRKLANGLD